MDLLLDLVVSQPDACPGTVVATDHLVPLLLLPAMQEPEEAYDRIAKLCKSLFKVKLSNSN